MEEEQKYSLFYLKDKLEDASYPLFYGLIHYEENNKDRENSSYLKAEKILTLIGELIEEIGECSVEE